MEEEKKININFVDRGFAGMENDLQKMEAEEDKKLNAYFIPGKKQGTFKVIYNNKKAKTSKNEEKEEPARTLAITTVAENEESKKIKDLFKDKQLTISSVNCAYTIIDGKFYKVQISEVADPLINEVIFTKILTNEEFRERIYPQSGIVQEPQIFPNYIDHFSMTGGDLFPLNNSIISTVYTNYKVLVTKAITKPISLCDLLDLLDKFDDQPDNSKDVLENFEKLMTTIKVLIEILLTNYKVYGEKLGFIHSDLHSNNIQIENGGEINLNIVKSEFNKLVATLSLKIIDFGRCFVFNEEQIKEDRIKEELAKFNLTNQTINFNNNWQLKNLRNPTEPYDYYCKQYGYLCDVAQVALNLLMRRGIENDRVWFNLIEYNEDKNPTIDRTCINIDTSYLPRNLDMIDHGLMWLTSYLYACKTKITNGNTQRMNEVIGIGDVLIYFKEQKNVLKMQFDLSRVRRNTLLIKNCMFNPAIFSESDEIQIATCEKYELLAKVNVAKSSGGRNPNKKMTVTSKKQKKDKKETKDIELEEMDGGANYIKENLELPTDRLTFGKKDGTKPFGKKNPNPLSTREDIDLADLGKPASQIFLEHIQKEEHKYEKYVTFETYDEPKEITRAVLARQTTRSATRSATRSGSFITNPQAAGGSNKKTYKIKTENSDKKSKRKYIRKSNEHWYLDEHRGQYRYSDETRTKIYLL